MHLLSNRRSAVCILLFFFLALAFPGIQLADQSRIHPGKVWQVYCEPGEAGWSATKLEEAREYYKALGSSAAVFIHGGKIVASWGDVRYKFRTHSIRKSLLNTLYGIHVEEGRIDLKKNVTDGYYDLDDHQSIHPACAVRMSALDMARYGLLYLYGGYWKNEQIIPRGWIEKVVTLKSIS